MRGSDGSDRLGLPGRGGGDEGGGGETGSNICAPKIAAPALGCSARKMNGAPASPDRETD